MNKFSQEQFLEAARSGRLGEFLGEAFRSLQEDDWKLLTDQSAATHAKGQLDLLAAVARISKLDYATRDFLQNLLPKLKLTLPNLLALFAALNELSGANDLAWWRSQVFEGWCLPHADRPEVALEAIDNGEAPGELLHPALFAALKVDPQRYLSALLSRLKSPDEESRTTAAKVLGHSSNLTGQKLDIAFNQLKRSFVNADGSIHADSLAALISIALREPRFEPASVAAVETATKSQQHPSVRSAAAREVLGKLGVAGEPLVQAVFTLLADTKGDEVDTVETIDLLIYNGLKGTHAQHVATLLDHLISSQEIPLQRFDSACNAILTGERKQLEGHILRWLANGRDPMIQAVHDLIATNHGDPLAFHLDFSSASLPAEQAIVLARKLAVSLGIYPVTLASLLLSLIATGPKQAVPSLKQLVYDPLLVNYRVSPREYLEKASSAAGPIVKAIIAELLSAQQNYLDAIDAADPIPEMWPSDRHRYLVALKDVEEQRAISRAAETQSILMSLVSKSVVLYGDAAIIGVHVEPGKVVRQESRMQTLEHWHELPRVELIDPVGQWYRRATLANGKDI